MKRITLIAMLVALAATAAFAQTAEEQKKITVDELLRMIDYVREQPFSSAAEQMFPLIIGVASNSDLVYVEITEAKLPWLAGIQQEPWARYLVGGYIAGNMEHQLKNDVKQDSPEAAFRFALSVYRKLKAINPDVRIDAFESGL